MFTNITNEAIDLSLSKNGRHFERKDLPTAIKCVGHIRSCDRRNCQRVKSFVDFREIRRLTLLCNVKLTISKKKKHEPVLDSS